MLQILRYQVRGSVGPNQRKTEKCWRYVDLHQAMASKLVVSIHLVHI